MSSEPSASTVGGINGAWWRRRPSRGEVVLIAVAGLVGAVAGGWLDYNTLP
jgi:uncharacterized membrane protein YfcA